MKELLLLSIINYMNNNNNKKEKVGRGWHGDSSGHAKAGQMGGKARARKKKEKTEKQTNQ